MHTMLKNTLQISQLATKYNETAKKQKMKFVRV